MCNCIWMLSRLCLLVGCADQGPADLDSAAPRQGTGAVEATSAGKNSAAEVLRRAIAAFGGDSAREKLRTCKVTSRCVVSIQAAVAQMGGDTFVLEDSVCHPDRWRRTVRRASDGTEIMLFVSKGDKHWARYPGKRVEELPVPPPNMRKPAILATLDQLTALRESNEEIVVAPPEETAGRTLISLTIMAKGRPRSTTYFDRSTNLIVKEIKYYLPGMHDPPETWTKRGPVEAEITYGDYKTFDGVTLPTHMVLSQAGKTVFDVSILRVEFPSKFDASTFEKPQDE